MDYVGLFLFPDTTRKWENDYTINYNRKYHIFDRANSGLHLINIPGDIYYSVFILRHLSREIRKNRAVSLILVTHLALKSQKTRQQTELIVT